MNRPNPLISASIINRVRGLSHTFHITIILTLAFFTAAAPRAARAGVLDEIWVGGFAHDVSDIGHDNGKESGTEDTILEADTARPGVLRILGAPRIGLSLGLNSAGLTNSGAVSLVWDHHLFGPLYGSVDLGMGLSDGVSQTPAGVAGVYDQQHRLLLGSKVLFREAAGVDWRLNDRWSIGGEFVHFSNGLILAKDHNQGVNDAGIRLGYRFR